MGEGIDFGKKKKKEKKEKKDKGGEDGSPTAGGAEDKDEDPLVCIDHEEGEMYEYTDLLDRLFDTIEQKTGAFGMKDKFTLKPPQVARYSAKKTSWANFLDVCEALNRPQEHLKEYTQTELGCDGTSAGERNEQFILKGKFYPRNVESLLRKYIREYVLCTMCRSSDTLMDKDPSTRLYFVNCTRCGASRSCATIKTGYHATSKADRKRAKLQDNTFQVQG